MLKPDLSLENIAHHRNGVSGLAFHVVLFKWRIGCNWRPMLATLFEAPGAVAVLDRQLAAMGNIQPIEPPRGNAWHGDLFEPQLRRWVADHEKIRHAVFGVAQI